MDKRELDRYLSQSDDEAHPEWFKDRSTGATDAQIVAAMDRWADDYYIGDDRAQIVNAYRQTVQMSIDDAAAFLVPDDHRIVPLDVLRRVVADVAGYKRSYTTADDINLLASLIGDQ